MSNWVTELIVSSPDSGEDLSGSVGLAAYDNGTAWVLADDSTQVAVEARRAGIITDGGSASGSSVEVVASGDYVPAMAGTGGWTAGDELIIEASTAKLINAATNGIILGPGDYIMGKAQTTTSANASGLVKLDPRQIPNPRPVAAASQITTAGAHTYTEAELAPGYIDRDPNGAARSDVLPNGGTLGSLLPVIGSTHDVVFLNAGAATEDVTFTDSADGTTVAKSAPAGVVAGDGKYAKLHLVRIAASGAGSVVCLITADGT